MAIREADKIITKAAREVLKPEGLFQKGTSRIWLDDQGWFLTVVEFQPSSWSQGAYLNVAVSFLWEQGEGFREALPYDVGGRMQEHIPYAGDQEVFYKKMLDTAQKARKQVQLYRKEFANHSSAVYLINQSRQGALNVNTLWDLAMFDYLNEDDVSGDEQMKNMLLAAEQEKEYSFEGKTFTREWVVEKMDLAERLLVATDKKEHVMDSIREKRARLRQKSSFKKFALDPLFQ